MISNLIRRDEGFTLIELIMVIVIIGILASIAVPKFVNLQDAANTATCKANLGAMNSAAAMQYAAVLVADPTQGAWLEELVIGDVVADWFATGAVPACPTTGTYSVVTGICYCDIHNPG